MRRKKAEPHIEVKCDYCGSMTDCFVVNAEYKKFCRHQTVGYPPRKDCMGDYLEEKKNVQEKEKSKKSEKEEQEEKILMDRKTAIKKLDDLKKYLSKKKQACYENGKANTFLKIQPSKNDSKT